MCVCDSRPAGCRVNRNACACSLAEWRAVEGLCVCWPETGNSRNAPKIGCSHKWQLILKMEKYTAGKMQDLQLNRVLCECHMHETEAWMCRSFLIPEFTLWAFGCPVQQGGEWSRVWFWEGPRPLQLLLPIMWFFYFLAVIIFYFTQFIYCNFSGISAWI